MYVDTIVLPDPFLRSGIWFEKWSDEQKAHYLFKHALNLLQYKDLVLAEVDPPIRLKLVVDADRDRLLGAHILGPNAAEMIQLIAIPVKMGATKADLDATMALHPTVAEELVTMRKPTRRYRRAAAE